MQPDKRCKNQALAYTNRVLNKACYSVTHLEALAVVWSLKQFRFNIWLQGSCFHRSSIAFGILYR